MERLNFIDISSWQADIDLGAVFAGNPLDGIIVKATEGMKYVNPHCDKWVQWLIANEKPWGFYHFLNGKDPTAEARWFIEQTRNYWGAGVPVADYEGSIVSEFGTYYLRRFLETCYTETGIKPLVYCNLSTIQSDVNGFRTIAEDGYKLWLAQYASSADMVGFRLQPWQQGSYAPFDRITMHQYSDHGRLIGYSGALDLDIFYGTEKDWELIAQPKQEEPAETDWLALWIADLEAERNRIQDKIDELRRRLT